MHQDLLSSPSGSTHCLCELSTACLAPTVIRVFHRALSIAITMHSLTQSLTASQSHHDFSCGAALASPMSTIHSHVHVRAQRARVAKAMQWPVVLSSVLWCSHLYVWPCSDMHHLVVCVAAVADTSCECVAAGRQLQLAVCGRGWTDYSQAKTSSRHTGCCMNSLHGLTNTACV
jgi:hypothetical protein